MTQLVKTCLGFFVGVSPFSQIMYEFILLFFSQDEKEGDGGQAFKEQSLVKVSICSIKKIRHFYI